MVGIKYLARKSTILDPISHSQLLVAFLNTTHGRLTIAESIIKERRKSPNEKLLNIQSGK